ncbi:amidase domain-containing protein [Streptomyces sp. Ncost-T10-10d]|uniref:amidase domain-containing protein n=1 Tax=Streptomyces sp. Ncost-T10-10d TaxID=1839774 RepID=UPI00081F7445|nr:amidase domain-containing protein [Streptomyces sp. Ncost-T10-10d]SCF77598.1 Putative amidase domain-containing protein [Streptomyces sp. Ncost-T10-10d]
MRTAYRRRIVAAITIAAVSGILGAAPASSQDDSQPVGLSASEVDGLSQLAGGYLQARASMVTTTPPQARMSVISATPAMANRTSDEFALLAAKGKRYEQVDGGYTKAVVDVTVTDSSLEGATATLQLAEDTRLYMPFTAAEVAEGAPEYEEFSLPHTVTFDRTADGTWLLASDKADTGSGPAPSTQLTEPDATEDTGGGTPDEEEGAKDTPSGTDELPDGSTKDVKLQAGYDYGKIVAYADKYWKNPNKGSYRTYGNDCTNFVSQAMKAGGWGIVGPTDAGQRSNNKKWFYTIFVDRTSYTWAGAENWYWFAIKHSKRTKALDNVYKLASSDVLQADWDRNGNINHTMVVTKKYNGVPYLTYHTTNTHNKSLKKLVADHGRAWWYAHRT